MTGYDRRGRPIPCRPCGGTGRVLSEELRKAYVALERVRGGTARTQVLREQTEEARVRLWELLEERERWGL